MNGRKRGRPPGAVDSPEELSRRELIRGLKLYRELLDDITKDYRARRDTMKATEKMEIAEFLRRSNTDFMRLWIAPAKSGDNKETVEEMDPQKILENLLGEKR